MLSFYAKRQPKEWCQVDGHNARLARQAPFLNAVGMRGFVLLSIETMDFISTENP
jgi:hypothetical protein